MYFILRIKPLTVIILLINIVENIISVSITKTNIRKRGVINCLVYSVFSFMSHDLPGDKQYQCFGLNHYQALNTHI